MTKEKRQLLLKDLCGRLPHGVILRNEEGFEGHLNSINQTIFGTELGVNVTATKRVDFQLDTVKPYLRPMSSMTEEERKEFNKLMSLVEERCINAYGKGGYTLAFTELNDWLNEHHFDYRGLIEKGLALEAKRGADETP